MPLHERDEYAEQPDVYELSWSDEWCVGRQEQGRLLRQH
jgi:hypothetical protein